MKNHEHYMSRALALAEKGKGWVNPNPMVGAVIVADCEIIGQGWHRAYGQAHAEVSAIQEAKKNHPDKLYGSTIYVTLEPCAHYGKTPPCADLIVLSGIARVVIGAMDPNPLVAGKGVEILEKAGVEVVSGMLDKECQKLNEVFMKYIHEKRPFVLFKAAMSLDGKIATGSGESKWISGENSRREVQGLRHDYMGVMVGVDTVIADNPRLTCRLDHTRQPIPIVADTYLRIPLDADLVTGDRAVTTIVLALEGHNPEKAQQLRQLGVTVVYVPEKDGRIDLDKAMKCLGEKGIDSILLEGGGTLAYGAVAAGVVDKVRFYIAPKLIGGSEAKTPMEGPGITSLAQASQLDKLKFWTRDRDVVIEGYIRKG